MFYVKRTRFRSLCFFIVVLVAVLGLSTVCYSQAQAGGGVRRPVDEAAIDQTIPAYKVISSSFEDLAKLPTPVVLFVFEAEKSALTELSPQTQAILNEHWKSALKFFYDQQFRKPRSAQESIERDRRWSLICNKTVQRLMQIEIE